ncbi:MAG TPA: pantetheine-phosphate adenylyltransferase [candidate division Zixibacteria bacterium]|nr:pantetheine-phosphate adenylyltransferase [candidate division Zixibacteria bacterium]
MPAQKIIHRAIYPGTFDPVTNGHLSLIERASHLFGELIIAVSMSAGKNPLFEFEERIKLMQDSIRKQKYPAKVRIVGFEGLLAELAVELKATAIIRGLRAISDFEYEFQMALMNRKLAHDVETVFLMPALSWVYLSSTIVKDVARHGGDISNLVPTPVKRALNKKLGSLNE